jgi:hypothetical protein
VLQSGYGYISNVIKYLYVILAVLQSGYGYIRSATKWLWLY